MTKPLLQTYNLLNRRIFWVFRLLLFSGLLFGFGSCSNTRYLKEGQKLYVGSTVSIKADHKVEKESDLQTSLEEVITPKPNTSILGLRPGLWIYNIAGTPKKKKGFRYWVKTKIGEAPVLYEDVSTEKVISLMENRLHNNGYFENQISFTAKEKRKRVTVNYQATIKKPYVIKSVEFPQGDSVILDAIRKTQPGTLLKPGDRYNLNTMIAERLRINDTLKNHGFFYFDEDMLIFKVDSTEGNRQVDIRLRVKHDAPAKAIIPYTVNNVYIFTDYTLGYDSIPSNPPVLINEYHYYPDEKEFKAKAILPAVFFAKGQVYSRQDHSLTLHRLMGLGIFKYVNVRFAHPDTTVSLTPDTVNGVMDVFISLTPALKRSLRTETQMVSKSNNFAGPGLLVSYRNRNTFRGAELFMLNGRISSETQVSGRGGGLNSYTLEAQAEVYVPRFITPFRIKNARTEFVPKTRFGLGFSFVDRRQYYKMMAYNALYSYIWKPYSTVTHEVTPINVQYLSVTNVTPIFEEILQERPQLRQSFEEQFIIGSIYNYNYNTQSQKYRRNHYYFNGNVDVAGNFLNAFKKQVLNQDENPNTVLQKPFSQYTRLEADFRYYYALTRKSKWANRIIVGAGIPYGNSDQLPYIKQFSVGGSNSLRAFRPRSVGPGTYKIPEELADSFFDQTGDIKIELNTEYRFDINQYLNGALFLDAGNIWLVNESEERPGGKFTAGNIFNELALGTGFGLRVDVEFFVLRFDLGIPLRDPSDPDGGAGGSPILNIAIGYPF